MSDLRMVLNIENDIQAIVATNEEEEQEYLFINSRGKIYRSYGTQITSSALRAAEMSLLRS